MINKESRDFLHAARPVISAPGLFCANGNHFGLWNLGNEKP